MKPALHIIDTHQHLWDPRTQRLAWLAGAPPLLSQTYGPAEYQQATSGHRVQAVYMEVDVVPEDRIAEMQKIVEIIGTVNSLTFAAVVSGPVGESGFQDYLDSLIAHPQVRGLRRVLHNDEIGRGYCLQPTFIEDVRELGRRGLSFDICIRPRELDDARRLSRRVPRHCLSWIIAGTRIRRHSLITPTRGTTPMHGASRSNNWGDARMSFAKSVVSWRDCPRIGR